MMTLGGLLLLVVGVWNLALFEYHRRKWGAISGWNGWETFQQLCAVGGILVGVGGGLPFLIVGLIHRR